MAAIPKIIHQTWKSDEIPLKWRPLQRRVQEVFPDWEYRLWTDADCDDFVREHYPEFYDVYAGFRFHIMRVDVVRYLIMYKIGGLYLDLDYEFFRPYPFDQYPVVLPMNRSVEAGDAFDGLGNCVFASAPGHPYWKAVIDDLQKNPPDIRDYTDVIEATGPMLLTRIYDEDPAEFPDIDVPGREIFHASKPRNRRAWQKLREDSESVGIHHCWGSWKDHLSWAYLRNKWRKLTGRSQR